MLGRQVSHSCYVVSSQSAGRKKGKDKERVKMFLLRLILVAVMATVATVSASCMAGKASMSAQGRRECRLPGGVTLEPGQAYLTRNCFDCTCHNFGFTCCGVGPMAGVRSPPPGFKEEVDWNACTVKLVRDN
ncbi:uncharacterized protein LOC143289954 [Babylonia areolata]|uniref:uncharacterized protein LOC143289954 n=1 Tax=Babylonia areolata TaxID=304850 RepID=UPI003FD2B644